MEKPNISSQIIAEKAIDIRDNPDYVVSPRGMEVREQLAGQYTVPMMAYIDNADRNVNYDFMFAEAAWICSGSNHLRDLTETMKSYANYSDDGIFLNGSYGVKVVEQLRYVVDTLESDNDSRQAFLNIWRERPSNSKDVPCTTSMQFLIRDNKLNMISNMRSNDIILGATYDIFSFSSVANCVRLLLKERGVDVDLGDLTVNAGSLHLYEKHYDQVDQWAQSDTINQEIGQRVMRVMEAETYYDFIDALKEESKKSS